MRAGDVRILLINPPLTDPHGPYPAVAYLEGFLREHGYDAASWDASLDVVLELFSSAGIDRILERLQADQAVSGPSPSFEAAFFVKHSAAYRRALPVAIECLQGRHDGAELLIARAGFLPPRLAAARAWAQAAYYSVTTFERLFGAPTPDQRARLQDPQAVEQMAFGTMGAVERARFRASGILDDLVAILRCVIDPDFTLNAYAERLDPGAATFAPLQERLERSTSLLDDIVDGLVEARLSAGRPHVVGLSVPFAGSLYGALRIARRIKQIDAAIHVALGGGWITAHLRHLSDPGIFDYVDSVVLDDGEQPLRAILEVVRGVRAPDRLLRTFARRQGAVELVNDPGERDIAWAEGGRPTYRSLPLHKYLAYRSEWHPFSQLVNRRWNKLTLAHGCYWKRCTFCDTELDYIARYSPLSVDGILDRIRALVDETGERGFHFVDEAMPPALLRRLAERLASEGPAITWWGNVRFDEALGALAPTLAASGCVALSGGLEAASDRLLALMDKGVSLTQVGRVTAALSRAGIGVHAYLIYGFPTQSDQETVDALEFVRQLYAENCLQSSVWHRFTLTASSPIAASPERFGIQVETASPKPFSNYILNYRETSRARHDALRRGLLRANGAYMAGAGLHRPVASWFGHDVPDTTLPASFVHDAITITAK